MCQSGGLGTKRLARAILALSLLSAGCTEWLSGLWPFPLPEGGGASGEPRVYVNLQIDAEQEDTAGITKMVEELKRRGINTTIYVTADYANRNALLVQDFYRDGFEIALHGYYTGEQLASMTYDEQKDLLTRAMTALQGCKPCGTYKAITGFRPQYFSQNEDTYRVLDELSITHNSGYKAGLLYAEGHEADTAPYRVDDHGFQAVPITTIEYGGERIYLCDIACANVEAMAGQQWGEALSAGFEQAKQTGQPFVALLHGWYTGDDTQYDYWPALVSFLDLIQDEAQFVTTQELADLYAD